MAFEIKPIDRAAFDEIWTAEIRNQLNIEYIYNTNNWTDDDTLSRRKWAIDEKKRAALLWVRRADRMDGTTSYVLAMGGEFALFGKVGFGMYEFVVMSGGFKPRIEEVKAMIAEALCLGGATVDGNPGPSNLNVITKVQFAAA
jgi:hypothetical protein